MAKQNRSWFFTTIGDTLINGFWQRFKGGKISKPTEATMQNLVDSVPFFKEVDSAASADSVAALETKQGLGIKASIASAQAGSDAALGGTGGTVFTSPSHLPTLIDSVTDQTIRDFTGKPLERVVDITGSNNKYSFNFRTAFITMLSKFLLPSFVGGDALKVVRVNAGETAYELATVSAGTGGASYSGVSVTSNSIANGTKTFAITPDAGTFKVAIGNRIRFTDSSDSANYVEGIVSAATSGSITIEADNFGGTGTIADWEYNLGGNIPSADVTGVANLYVDNLSGNDTTGDGSIIKPFKTLAMAISVVGNNQTIIMFGGSYTNSINIVKAGVNYTLYCFPGVTITQTITSFYDSLAVVGRVDIYGRPNIVSTSLAALPTFVVNQVAQLSLGKISGAFKIFDIYSRYQNTNGVVENTVVDFLEASYAVASDPAIKIMKSAGGGAIGNGTVLLKIGSLEYEPNGSTVANANYIEIVDPYTCAITGNLLFRGSGTLTTPDFIKVTSTTFVEVAINRLNCRLGGAAVTGGKIINLMNNNISSNKFFVKDVTVSISAATFATASVASSFYAEDIILPTGSTIQGGSATIKTIAPAHANTRTYVAGDNNLSTMFNF